MLSDTLHHLASPAEMMQEVRRDCQTNLSCYCFPENLAHSLCIREGVTSAFWLTGLTRLRRLGLVSMVTWMLSGCREGGRAGACFIPELIKKKRKENLASTALMLLWKLEESGLRMKGRNLSTLFFANLTGHCLEVLLYFCFALSLSSWLVLVGSASTITLVWDCNFRVF